MNVADLLHDHRLVVCVGSGGVGKTTVAAALALRGAMEGRRAMVLTIDPARRLAQALGVGDLRPGGEQLAPSRLLEAGLDPGISLSAGMLDQKSAWDEFIARHSPTVEIRDTILANTFYRHLSQSFAGSTEYMAIEELCRIDESGRYDLIVLDTPPTGHALDFLEAPRRLEDFFDRSVLTWLVRPTMAAGWSVWKNASRTVRFLLERIEDATGVAALADIGAFFAAIEGLVDGVRERSRSVRALLQGPATAFVLVAGPDEQLLEDAEDLAARMRALGVGLRGVVMNRVHPPAEGPDDETEWNASFARLEDSLRAASVPDRERLWLRRVVDDYRVLSGSEAIRRESFELALEPGVAVAALAEQSHDVHDLEALAGLAGLFEVTRRE